MGPSCVVSLVIIVVGLSTSGVDAEYWFLRSCVLGLDTCNERRRPWSALDRHIQATLVGRIENTRGPQQQLRRHVAENLKEERIGIRNW